MVTKSYYAENFVAQEFHAPVGRPLVGGKDRLKWSFIASTKAGRFLWR
jgi:hypothetical protein